MSAGAATRCPRRIPRPIKRSAIPAAMAGPSLPVSYSHTCIKMEETDGFQVAEMASGRFGRLRLRVLRLSLRPPVLTLRLLSLSWVDKSSFA